MTSTRSGASNGHGFELRWSRKAISPRRAFGKLTAGGAVVALVFLSACGSSSSTTTTTATSTPSSSTTAPAPVSAVNARYAYAKGGTTSPTACPQSATTSHQCTLAQALSLAGAGDTVVLATPGSAGHFVGNWTVDPTGTSPSAPLTIESAPGVARPVLDGNQGKPADCQTAACNGPILSIGSKVHVALDGLTLQNADNTNPLSPFGGAIQNQNGGTLSVSDCRFLKNTAIEGGAIDQTYGTLSVSGSTFTTNTATGSGGTHSYDGGAIDNGDNGSGTVSVLDSTFTADTAGHGAPLGSASAGGAIDNGDDGGRGTLTVSGSTFTGNTVSDCPGYCTSEGGAINNADNGGTGTLTVSGSSFSANFAHGGGAICNGTGRASASASTFTDNTADYGAAIDNGDSGTGTLTISGSTFTANRATEDGGAIHNGYSTSTTGTVIVSASTFYGNSAAGTSNDPDTHVPNGYGGAIDNEATGTLVVSNSSFSANTAEIGGGTISNFGLVWATADIFSGPCHEAAQGSWNDSGYNVGSDATCLKAGIGDVSHGAGYLGPLAHNGGPTKTMQPLASNPAVGIVPLNTAVTLNGNAVTLCPTTDQRGTPSAAGKACNAGAVQSAS